MNKKLLALTLALAIPAAGLAAEQPPQPEVKPTQATTAWYQANFHGFNYIAQGVAGAAAITAIATGLDLGKQLGSEKFGQLLKDTLTFQNPNGRWTKGQFAQAATFMIALVAFTGIEAEQISMFVWNKYGKKTTEQTTPVEKPQQKPAMEKLIEWHGANKSTTAAERKKSLGETLSTLSQKELEAVLPKIEENKDFSGSWWGDATQIKLIKHPNATWTAIDNMLNDEAPADKAWQPHA